MAGVTLYHNPRCSKCRGALALLRERGEEPEIVEYLEQPPDRAALDGLLERLAGEPAALVRRDDRFRALDIDPASLASREAVRDLLLAHPELLQRPVVVRGDAAVIARPPEKLLALLEESP